MPEYIEKETIYRKIAELEELAMRRYLDTPINSPACDRYSTQLGERTAMKHLIADFPAADVAPVVHGRWIKTYEDCDLCHECSLCGKPALLDGNEREVLSPWCPHCGAKMDLE